MGALVVLDLLPEEEVVFGEAGAEVFEEEWTDSDMTLLDG